MKVKECLLDFPSQWAPDEGFVRVVEVSTQGEDVDREGSTEGGKVYARRMAAGSSTGLDARRVRFGCGGRTVA